MVTLLLILMMACNLWILFYLTWERKEARKADNREDAGNAHQDYGQEQVQDAGNEATNCHSDAKCCHGNAKRGGGREGRYL